MLRPLDSQDIEHVFRCTSALWPDARGSRILLTGGTGFFGLWLLESLVHANRRLSLGISATVLTRDPDRFARRVPHLATAPELRVVKADMADLSDIEGPHDLAIHAATETRADLATIEPLELFDRNVQGTREFLAAVKRCGVRRFLFTSSGAVYGTQPASISKLREDDCCAPDAVAPGAAYGESKRVSEFLCARSGDGRNGVAGVIARCFAFVGPHLPLDANYAVGNFLRDAMEGRTIEVRGDGMARRSYLYAADLAVWLWTLLFAGAAGQAYNVGSERDMSIRELAETVARVHPSCPGVRVLGVARPGVAPACYVPSTRKAREILGLRESIGLEDALRRTLRWHGAVEMNPLSQSL